jgi:microcystin-dependent protein
MDPFIGEIRLFPWGYAPTGWLPCDGRLLQITQNQALWSLLSNTYGGDGKSTFALPDLQGRVPIQTNMPTIKTAANGGEEGVVLTVATMPAHTHQPYGVSANANKANINGNLPAKAVLSNGSTGSPLYGPLTAPVSLAGAAVGPAGAAQPHPNMQPFLVLNFCIASQGLYPTRP